MFVAGVHQYRNYCFCHIPDINIIDKPQATRNINFIMFLYIMTVQSGKVLHIEGRTKNRCGDRQFFNMVFSSMIGKDPVSFSTYN